MLKVDLLGRQVNSLATQASRPGLHYSLLPPVDKSGKGDISRTGLLMADTAWFATILVIAGLELALYAGAVFFAYKMTKLTGSFRSWTMIIAALLLTTISGLSGIFLVLSNPDTITGLVQSIGVPTLIVTYTISISTCLLYFFGTHGLVKNFQQIAAKKSAAA